MKRIIIAGAGFAGISAVKHMGNIAGNSAESEIMIFDKNDYTTIIPSLPDVAAKRFGPNLPKADVRDLLPRGVLFKNEEIEKIDLNTRTVSASSKDYGYDYLLLSAGSRTNFYGFNQNLNSLYVLDSLTEAQRLEEAFDRYLDNKRSHTLLISGAGFTGIEIACFLKKHAEESSRIIKVILVEKADRVLGNMPAVVSGYVESLISQLGFEVVKNSSVAQFNGEDVTLETGEVFEDVFFAWTSGTKRAIEDINGGFTSLPDGRMDVNEFLQVAGYTDVFAAGDCAALKSGDIYLRKAAAFAVASGATAGRNIVRSLKNMPLKRFRPIDIGWVIPLYPSSIGKLYGIPIRGRLGLCLHYLACGYRAHDLKSRMDYLVLGLRNLL
jgi:NADH:quinone reductase (non-electrogenic)